MSSFLNLVKANTRKEFIELKRYLPNTISMILTFYIIFVAMLLGIHAIGDPSQAETNIQYAIVSYIFWFLTMMALSDVGYVIMIEATRGTLEQLYMSPKGMWRILLSRFIGTLFNYGIIITLLLFLSMATAGQWLNLKPQIVIPLLILTLLSIVGTGYMIAGLCVIFKQINSFLQILQFILMGLTFIPLSVAPFLVIAPFVKGVDMIRHVMIQNYSWADFAWHDYTILIVNGIVYMVVGIWVYLKCEKIAMEKGILNQY